jgi:hypothetical protein
MRRVCPPYDLVNATTQAQPEKSKKMEGKDSLPSIG